MGDTLAVSVDSVFESSSDRKTTPYARRKGKGRFEATPLRNAFGLPAGPHRSCVGATSWCWDDDNPVCYAESIARLFTNVGRLLERNWDVYQRRARSVPGLCEALRPMLDAFVAECGRREVDPVFRWFWDGDIPGRNFAKAIRCLADEYSDVRFWLYTRNFGVVPLLGPVDNLVVYLSVDPANMVAAAGVKRECPWVRLAFCADTWDESEALAARFVGERRGPRCPELTGRVPLVVWGDGREGVGACVDCGLCISGVNNVRFAAK